MSALTLNNFKLLKEDADNYHLVHPEGRKFTVSKKGLRPKALEIVKSMAHFDAGGTVPQDFVPGQDYSNAPLPGDQNSQFIPAGALQPVQTSQIPPPATDDLIPPPRNVAQTPPDLSSSVSDNTYALDNIANYEENAAKNYLGQTDAMARKEAAARGNEVAALQQLPLANTINDAFKPKDDEFRQKLLNNDIDANRYWHNKDTGSKVLSGIGVILAGLGSHATGGENLALNQINKNIDRDIAAQKQNQDKGFTLYKMNREALGTDQAANLATQNQLITIAQAKTQQQLALQPSIEAKLRGAQLIAQFEQQKAGNRFKLNVLQSASQPAGGGGNPTDPAALVPALVPEAHQKDVFNEIKQGQNAAANEKDILDNFQKASQENTLTGRVAHAGFTPPSIKSLNALVDPLIHDNEGRINELEQQHVQALFPSVGDRKDTIQQKMVALKEFIDHKKSAPTAKAYGINLNNFQSTASAPTSGAAAKGYAPGSVLTVKGRGQFIVGPDGNTLRPVGR